MSIFGKIMSAILGTSASATPASAPSAGGGATASTGAAAGSSSATASSAAKAAPGQTVDVASVVDKAAAASGEKLEWRTSIVDLMKALKIDSSLTARKELAKELGYTGDTNDFGEHEYLAAQAGDGQACREWRQAAAGDQALTF